MTNVNSVKLPYYFYSLDSTLPDGKERWFDEFSDDSPHVIRPGMDDNISYLRRRSARNEAYSRWQAAFFVRGPDNEFIPIFKPKMMKWQAIRVLAYKHSESHKNDWWEHYQDALFRVFVQPETFYDDITGEYKQWYLLSPEDGYLVNRYELEKKGPTLPPRDRDGREVYLSADRRLRKALFIPTECCHHLRNEGALDTDNTWIAPTGL